MSSTPAVLIFNPKTGRYGSRSTTSIESICARLQSLGVEVDLRPTSGPGDAATIAATAARKRTRNIIVSGGDGTINEALQGLVGSNVRIGILPRGTANVLARELQLPLDPMQAAEVIAKGKTKRIHVGCASEEATGIRRYFFLMAGIGLDASVVRRVDPKLKKHFGKGAFWFSGLSHLATWKPTQFNLEIDGQSLPATFAVIGNAASYGGNLSVTPRAQLDHPHFEVCVIGLRGRLEYLRLLGYAMRSRIPTNMSDVHYLNAKRVRATGDAPVQVDGEVIGTLPMTFEIAEQTIDVFVP